MIQCQSPTSREPVISRDRWIDNEGSSHRNESTLFSRVLSSAEECLEDFTNCLPESLGSAKKYLWFPVAVVVGVVAKINLTYLALSVLGLLALQLIYTHLSERAPTPSTHPSTTGSGEIDPLLPHPAPTPITGIPEQPVVGSGRASTPSTHPSTTRSGEIDPLLPNPAPTPIRGAPEQPVVEPERASTPSTHPSTTGSGEIDPLLPNQAPTPIRGVPEQPVVGSERASTPSTHPSTTGSGEIDPLLPNQAPTPIRGVPEQPVVGSGRASISNTQPSPIGSSEADTLSRSLDLSLYQAVTRGDTEDIQNLLDNGANVNSDKIGLPPLMWAARNGHEEAVRLLLNKNANIESQSDPFKFTALIEAAKHGHTSIVRLLVKHKANLDHQTKHGETALHVARLYRRTETAEALIGLGATDS